MVGRPWACSGDAEGVSGGGARGEASAYHPIGTAANHAVAAVAAAEVNAHADLNPPALDQHGLPGLIHLQLWLLPAVLA